MNRFPHILLALSLLLLQNEASSQPFFQKYTSTPDTAFYLNTVAVIQNSQIAIGGQIVANTSGNKMATIQLFTESGTLLWSRKFGDFSTQSAIVDLADAPNGMLAVVHSETASGRFGVVKIGLDGSIVWSRFFNNNSNLEIQRIQKISSGYILTGKSGADAGMVKKIDANGTEIWSKNISASGASMSFQQASEDAKGNIYVTGSLLQSGSSDGVLLKFSAAGNLDWSRRFGTAENDGLSQLVQTADNFTLAGGYSFGVNNLKKGWLLKIDSAGGIEWSRTYGEPGLDVGIRSLQAYPGGAFFSISEDGNIPTLGAGMGQINFDGDLLRIKKYDQTGIGFNPQIAVAANNNLLLAAALQTGSGRGCLLARTNSEGDTPPCCLKSANLTVLNLLTTATVFVPTASVAPATVTASWSVAIANPNVEDLCIEPNLDFTISDTLLCPGECLEIEFNNPSPGTEYSWFYAGGIPDLSNPNRVCFPNLTEDATITLTANACEYSKSAQIVHAKSGETQYPNAFTPDGDAVNDIFMPILFCPSAAYRFSIFNRWGELVFETLDASQGWDGTVNGENAPSDVYIWLLETETSEGILQKKAMSLCCVEQYQQVSTHLSPNPGG